MKEKGVLERRHLGRKRKWLKFLIFGDKSKPLFKIDISGGFAIRLEKGRSVESRSLQAKGGKEGEK